MLCFYIPLAPPPLPAAGGGGKEEMRESLVWRGDVFRLVAHYFVR